MLLLRKCAGFSAIIRWRWFCPPALHPQRSHRQRRTGRSSGRLGGLAAETYDRTRTAGQSGAWRIRIQRAHAHTYVCGCERECKFCKFARFLNLKCINMKDFLYFPSMTKGSLALLYFPGSNPRIATRHLMRWINGCPPLMEELSATGYHTSQKVFTSRQVTLINRHLGSPG